MIQKKLLKDVYKDIRDELKSKLENAEELSDIETVIYGESTRIGSLRTPAIWIIPASYTPQLRGGHTAIHDIPFDLAVFVKDMNAQEGLQRAQDYAMAIYDVVTADRQLNGLVHDVRPDRLDPSYEAGQSTQLYWSAVQFTFRLQRRE